MRLYGNQYEGRPSSPKFGSDKIFVYSREQAKTVLSLISKLCCRYRDQAKKKSISECDFDPNIFQEAFGQVIEDEIKSPSREKNKATQDKELSFLYDLFMINDDKEELTQCALKVIRKHYDTKNQLRFAFESDDTHLTQLLLRRRKMLKSWYKSLKNEANEILHTDQRKELKAAFKETVESLKRLGNHSSCTSIIDYLQKEGSKDIHEKKPSAESAYKTNSLPYHCKQDSLGKSSSVSGSLRKPVGAVTRSDPVGKTVHHPLHILDDGLEVDSKKAFTKCSS